MEKIEIFYRLKNNSQLHGQFLVDMYQLDPDATMEKNFDFSHITETCVYGVKMNADVAILQKLKYSDCLAGEKKARLTPEERELDETSTFIKKVYRDSLKKRPQDYYYDDFWQITRKKEPESIVTTIFKTLKGRK